MRKILLFLLVTFLNLLVWAQNYETVVTGTSFNSTNKVILDQDTIRKSKAPTITSLLSSQANISVASTSFQPGSIYLRGGDSSHVLILLDGLPFYDASTVQKTINLDEIDIRSVRKIEVLKGPQSVLYGGQALTGVIKIETFPADLENQAGGAVELGQRQYRKASVAILKPNEAGNQALSAKAAYSEKNKTSPVKDSSFEYPASQWNADLAYLWRSEVDTFVRFSELESKALGASSDNVTFAAVDAQDFLMKNRISSLTAGLRGKNMPSHPLFLVGLQNSKRSFDQPINSTSTFVTDEKYGSDLINLRFESTLVDKETFRLLAGLSYQKESFVYRSSGQEAANAFNEQRGLFVKMDMPLSPAVEMEAGARAEIVNHRDRVDTAQLGFTLFQDWRLEYATGFKIPSLFQLYSSYGNSDLSAEKSDTLSASYEKSLNENHFFSMTLFHTRFDNLITTRGSPPKYYNVGRAESRGFEAGYSWKGEDRIRIDFNLGYQEPRDVTNARWLLRRPLRTASFKLQKEWEKDQISYEQVWKGERTDRSGSNTYRQLEPYTVTNISYSHRISDNLSAYTRGNNVFDRRYEESTGYYDEGAFWLVGLELQN